MLFGAVLGSRSLRESVGPDEFALEPVRNAVTQLKLSEDADKAVVAKALKEWGVAWDMKGKAVDAVRASVAENAAYRRALTAVRRELGMFPAFPGGDKRKLIDAVKRALPEGVAERYGLNE
jgi:hypothetical protein